MDTLNRRQFLGASAAFAAAAPLSAAPQKKISPSDVINTAHIGVGGRGSSLLRLNLRMAEAGHPLHVRAGCDVIGIAHAVFRYNDRHFIFFVKQLRIPIIIYQ